MTCEERAEKELAEELQMKPMGNMMWFLDSETPPRQLTKAERKLWKALVGHRVNCNDCWDNH